MFGRNKKKISKELLLDVQRFIDEKNAEIRRNVQEAVKFDAQIDEEQCYQTISEKKEADAVKFSRVLPSEENESSDVKFSRVLTPENEENSGVSCCINPCDEAVKPKPTRSLEDLLGKKVESFPRCCLDLLTKRV